MSFVHFVFLVWVNEMDDFQAIWDHQYYFLNGQVEVKVHEDVDAGLGGTLFDGSVAMVGYLENLARSTDLSSLKAIELGAGCGLPGLFLAKLGVHVVLTDVPGVAVELLQENIELNGVSTVARAAGLDWCSSHDLESFSASAFDLILAADTIYSIEAVEPFLQVLDYLTSQKVGCKVLLSHPKARVPAASEVFWRKAPEIFNIEKVDPKDFVNGLVPGSRQFQNPQQGVFILTRR